MVVKIEYEEPVTVKRPIKVVHWGQNGFMRLVPRGIDCWVIKSASDSETLVSMGPESLRDLRDACNAILGE